MRKKIFSLIFLYFCLCNVFAQNFSRRSIENQVEFDKFDVLDSAYLKCSYKLTYVCDSNKMDKKTDDLQILLIGKNISKYFSFYKWEHNMYVSEALKKDKLYYKIKKDAWSFEVFKNLPEGKLTVTDIVSMLGISHIYEENLPVFDWKIENETQTVFNYTCLKATVSFRGRDFVAWFAPEIPISNGPWKFGGLPGLILKLYDTRNQFVYECEGLDYLQKKEPVILYKVDYRKITRKELDKLYRRNHDDFVEYNFMLRGRAIELYNPKTKEFEPRTKGAQPQAYNPIEPE